MCAGKSPAGPQEVVGTDKGPGEVEVGLGARAAVEGNLLGSRTGPWCERPLAGLGCGG